jgi:Zn-dependent peptidase ImmA (M78 family)
MSPELRVFSKPFIVWLILNQRTEEALSLLANEYKVNVPKLKVGLPKGRKNNVSGCYQSKNETISVFNSDVFANPFVILHEFYHHLRSKSVDKQHRGTERNADKFATDFLKEYQTTIARLDS